MHALAVTVVNALVDARVLAEDKAPDDNDVVAGWTAFWIFIGLIVAVAVIGVALTRSLRTAQKAKDAGVYGDEPAPSESDAADRTE
ncbi:MULTISPECIES: hypothetical protein [unclassified Nocardioides]|uniref:hypothetical protein n=1 Tax=unclassified Nocardioides TaxID=2615069 RepID=UPI000702B9C5|nr:MULTISPECIES: hypothetical protein [unclassified Nocardioides]KRC46498.1 hypothetical protein ASE19_22035 [Nocardioides sp. Root79]KRC69843.1 hypothetical protein ASE20_14890 [Nocardioides sp. Root240]